MALPVDPTLALGVLDALADLQGNDVNARTEEEPGRIMHETASTARTARPGGARRTTGRSTPPRCSSCCSASWPAGGCRPRSCPGCCPTPTARSRGSRTSATGTATASSSTSERTLRAGQPGLEGLVGRHAPPRRPLADAPIALCEVQGYAYAAYRARADDRGERLATPRGGALHRGRRAQGAFNRGVLARRPRLVRHGPRPGQEAYRRPRLTWVTAFGRASSTRTRRGDGRAAGAPAMWTGWGSARSPPRRGLRSDELPLRLGRPRDTAVGIAGGSPPRVGATDLPVVEGLLAAADARKDGFLSSSRPGPVRRRRAHSLADLLLTPGLVVGLAVAAAPGAARAGARRAGRRGPRRPHAATGHVDARRARDSACGTGASTSATAAATSTSAACRTVAGWSSRELVEAGLIAATSGKTSVTPDEER